MTKKELVNSIASKTGMTKVDSNRALIAVFASMTEALKEGERISIPGFGSFYVNERRARQGRNPRTGEAITIKAKKVVKFKPGNTLPFPPAGW